MVFCTRVAWVCLVCLLLYKEEGYSPVHLQLLRRGIYGAIVYVFVGFCDGDYVNQLPYVWYYVVVKSSFKHVREKCESCLVKQFDICVGVVVILLLNIMVLFIVGGGALLDRPCKVFQRL